MMRREILKVSVWCLALATALSAGFTQGVAPRLDPPWLQVSYPGVGTPVPERTVILSTRRPAIREIAPGRWKITFPPK
jgi:hypothetical protein